MSPFERCGDFEKIENGVYNCDRYQVQNCMVWKNGEQLKCVRRTLSWSVWKSDTGYVVVDTRRTLGFVPTKRGSLTELVEDINEVWN